MERKINILPDNSDWRMFSITAITRRVELVRNKCFGSHHGLIMDSSVNPTHNVQIQMIVQFIR